MPYLTCHECRAPIPDDAEVWLSPELGVPDEDDGEPYCPACAIPPGIAA
ncbi:MAG: hypothetical protein AB7V42_14655 [Thermoleophilia bacterium]